jgi:hypothetical protein
MKTCTKCKHPFPATSEFFTSSNQNADGLHSWCRTCLRERGRTQVPRISETRRKRKMSDPHKMRGQALRNGMRQHARQIGVPFDEDFFTAGYLAQWLRETKACPCCGVKLLQVYIEGMKSHAKNSPSFDRVRPDLGYVQGNVALICNWCNTLKRDCTLDELQRMVDWVRSAQTAPQWMPAPGKMRVCLDMRHEIEVSSFKEASEAILHWKGRRCRAEFQRNRRSGLILRDTTIIAFVTHDGRVWEGTDRDPDGKREIHVDQSGNDA